MQKIGGLTLTIITGKVSGLNYGEGKGNIIPHKKITLANGLEFTYESDKAIKYNIRHQGKQQFGWKLLDKKLEDYIRNHTQKSGQDYFLKVDDFAKDLIKDYEEFDLFGGLFVKVKNFQANKGKNKRNSEEALKFPDGYDGVKRETCVTVNYAFSIEPYQGDMDFMTNSDAYERYMKHIMPNADKAIVLTEQSNSHYYYTVDVDLDRIGIWEDKDGNLNAVIDNETRYKRVEQLLEVIKLLYRKVKGRKENLSPIFVIGGVFSVKNPFFLDSIRGKEKENRKLYLEVEPILEALELIPKEDKGNVVCGISLSHFANAEEIKDKLEKHGVKVLSVPQAFEEYKKQVRKYYEIDKEEKNNG